MNNSKNKNTKKIGIFHQFSLKRLICENKNNITHCNMYDIFQLKF